MRCTTASVVLLTFVVRSIPAQAPTDTGAVLDSVAHQVAKLGSTYGDSMWPGFRPDTIPFAFVLPTHGTFLFGWRGALPEGYATVAGLRGAAWRELRALGAASTGTSIGGRRVAQVVVSTLDGAALTATAFHEAFHVFAGVARREGRRFGAGENSFYVATYPIFDIENEAAMALEGRILAAGLAASTTTGRRDLAQQFVAVRRARHNRILPEMAQFDQASEMNEGLAQYALIKTSRLLVEHGPPAWRQSAAKQLEEERRRLDDLTGNVTQSFRLRYYATGSAMALLLDALARGGPGWKARLVQENATLQEALGAASALDVAAEQARRRAETAFDMPRSRADAGAAIERLTRRRRAQVDSVLAHPGIRLLVVADSLASKDFSSCGFDPQNHLQVTPSVRLQTRWWRPCGGASTMMEFNVPSVHDAAAGSVTAVIGVESEVKITVDGKPVVLRDGETLALAPTVVIEAPRASLRTSRADIVRTGDTLLVRPRP